MLALLENADRNKLAVGCPKYSLGKGDVFTDNAIRAIIAVG